MKYSKEIQIALVAIASIVVLFFGLKFLKGMTLFSTDDNYYVTFDDIMGLSASSPIYANGYRVGVDTQMGATQRTANGPSMASATVLTRAATW